MRVLIPSTNTPKEWNLSVLRLSSGRIIADATEVDVERDAYGRITSIGYTIFQARTVKIPLDAKRLTAKCERDGLAALKAKLQADGLILPGHA